MAVPFANSLVSRKRGNRLLPFFFRTALSKKHPRMCEPLRNYVVHPAMDAISKIVAAEARMIVFSMIDLAMPFGRWLRSKTCAIPAQLTNLRYRHRSGALPDGETGWITLSEARALFGEMDQFGKASLVAFAEEREHRSIPEFMLAQGRVYFTRKAA
jgi:hypothetical protein